MNAKSMPQPIIYESQPSVVLVYEIPIPLDTNQDVDQQIHNVLFNTRLIEFNNSAIDFMDAPSSESIRGITLNKGIRMSGESHLTVVHEHAEHLDIDTRVNIQLKQFIDNKYTLEKKPILTGLTERYKHYTISYYGVLDNHYLTHVVVIYKDEGYSYHQEQLITTIAQSLVDKSEQSFFIHLIRYLTNIFELDYAAVGEIIPGADGMVKLLSFYNRNTNEQVHTVSECCVTDGPGYEVLKGQAQIYTSKVTKIFPENSYLCDRKVEAFIGVPLIGKNFQPLGAICLMHTSEIPNLELIQTVLTTFSIRAAAEVERVRQEKEHHLRDQRQLTFIKNNSNGMFVVDIIPPMDITLSVPQQLRCLAENSCIVECNDAAVSLLAHRDKNSLLGKSLFGGTVRYDFATIAKAYISEDYEFRDYIIKITPHSGSDKWVSTTNSSVITDGKLVQILGVVTDVTDRILHSKEMEHRAKHDYLTGLPNRNYFIEQAEQAIALSDCSSKHALFLLDLDGFKEVNDTLGHEVGDFLLQQIGPRVEPLFADENIIFARLGGDEFAVFIQSYDQQEWVIKQAGLLMEAIKSPFPINSLELTVGGSVGISLYPEDGDCVSSLMRCADVAMYQAKKQSTDFCMYRSDRDHYTIRRLSLMMDVRQAIDNNELDLHYQPIIGLNSQNVLGFEALIRWRHPEHGLLSPGEFVPLIELTDMVNPMTAWVVEKAIKQLSCWNKCNWPYRISVNISTRNLVDAGFARFIESCLRKYQVDGSRLELEITESTLMADPEKARIVLQALSELGTAISIDDYGTGYSSLAYLKSLPITTLKIDRTFISQMATNAQDRIIVSSTIQLAHNLGLDVTAEGIEDRSLIDELNGLGCDKGQGYYICRPKPLSELNKWLELYRDRELII